MPRRVGRARERCSAVFKFDSYRPPLSSSTPVASSPRPIHYSAVHANKSYPITPPLTPSIHSTSSFASSKSSSSCPSGAAYSPTRTNESRLYSLRVSSLSTFPPRFHSLFLFASTRNPTQPGMALSLASQESHRHYMSTEVTLVNTCFVKGMLLLS